MPKTDLVYCLLQHHSCKLSRIEKFLLEVKLLMHVCCELSEIFKSKYKEYHRLIKSNLNQDENMSNIKFMQEMIKDILSTREYNLTGIAIHTRIPEEVLFDVATGMNIEPTFETSRKIFELHISVRRNLYDEIMRKVASAYLVSQ
ncbi:MAG: hypothetical protein A3F42_04245 [Gammaproteobacteria bacterium RIFCSPHIGHO2_12_FULL_37_34]|nr:MAG: hypothetical protein A3F42_04245 [Gammaproteobacteria bacterium RIFCSPHIGHO2_12_FULL_37_34]